MLQREKSFLSRLSCDRIVKYLGSDITCEGEGDTTLYNVFMEYVSGGALSDEIRRRGDGLDDEGRIRLYTRQILLGLEYLHGNGVVHCDIKSENVLIREDGAVIADLGCAKSVQGNGGGGGGGGSVFYGTPVFMAPEVARGEEQGFPADIWALGCTVIEMATGCNPWPEVNDAVSAVYRIGFSGDVPETPMWLSENGRDFLDKCLRRNPRERWTAKELLKHPFLEEGLMETNSKQVIREFAMKSPTSVLDDQGFFWDSLEAPATSSVLPHIGSSSNSPAERIQRLNQSATSSGSNLPNWSWDEDWVTVRSNNIEERWGFSEEEEEEEPENLILNDNFFIENSLENISISSSFSISKALLLAHESVNDSLVFRDSIFRLIIRIFHLLQTVYFSLFVLVDLKFSWVHQSVYRQSWGFSRESTGKLTSSIQTEVVWRSTLRFIVQCVNTKDFGSELMGFLPIPSPVHLGLDVCIDSLPVSHARN